MPKNAVSDWDTTAANNSDVGGINIANGCPPSNMNDMGREMMAQIAASNFAAVAAGKKSRILSGVIRNTGSGWGLIADADHRSTGISGVSVVASGTSYAIRLTFSETATDVGSLLISP